MGWGGRGEEGEGSAGYLSWVEVTKVASLIFIYFPDFSFSSDMKNHFCSDGDSFFYSLSSLAIK